MPIYEYRCESCGETRTALAPISACKEPLVDVCVQRPLSTIEKQAGVTDADRKQCTFKRILSATPTTFRFNDRTGFKGLDKRRDR